MAFWKKHRETDSGIIASGEALFVEKRILASLIRAALFWNLGGGIDVFVQEDGIFAHSTQSAGNEFLAILHKMGVFVPAGRRGFQLTIRVDAIDSYAAYILDNGFGFDRVIDAFVLLLVTDGVSHILPNGRAPFAPTFYENRDGTTSFDTRAMLADLAELGYVQALGEQYVWTEKIGPAMRKIYAPEWE